MHKQISCTKSTAFTHGANGMHALHCIIIMVAMV